MELSYKECQAVLTVISKFTLGECKAIPELMSAIIKMSSVYEPKSPKENISFLISCQGDNKIDAIKLVRYVTGCGLYEAIKIVEGNHSNVVVTEDGLYMPFDMTHYSSVEGIKTDLIASEYNIKLKKLLKEQ